MRISNRRDAGKALSAVAVVLACAIAVSGCTDGTPEAKSADLCTLPDGSVELDLLRQIIAGELDTGSTPADRLTANLKKDLRDREPSDESPGRSVCLYRPEQQAKPHRVVVQARWVPRDASKDRPMAEGAPFDVNGVPGETNDIASRLYVPCDLPGDLRASSDKVWLKADVSYSVNIPRSPGDQARKDRQTTFAYLMARRVTEALGCENEPLSKPPVVSPVPTP
ncbi:hypothetical protein AB0P15_35145 [Streptomyces sp. NPDC087917]|uniref:hypothetical protein n=1 Tax=Streptomyces sp. NPDC087917 TaxID=3155060 RepID=UPI00343FE1D7